MKFDHGSNKNETSLWLVVGLLRRIINYRSTHYRGSNMPNWDDLDQSLRVEH